MNDSFADTIKPKSDQLNADDLMTGPITVKITGVKRGPADQPVHISIDGCMPYKPCKSMRRVLISAWGDKGSDWVGKELTLYCDPNVKFGGVAMGGIRISHLSHIKGVMNIMLTESRGRKSQFTIKELAIKSPDQQQDENAKGWVAAIISGASKLEDIADKDYRSYIEGLIK